MGTSSGPKLLSSIKNEIGGGKIEIKFSKLHIVVTLSDI